MKRLLIIIAIIAASVWIFMDSQSQPLTNIERTAPNFSLTNQDGETISLSEFSGQYVVLEWTNHQCPFVKKHYDSTNMQTLQKEMTDQGVIWLSIISSAKGKQGHVSGSDAQKIALAKGAHPTHILLDENGEVGRLYGAKTTPHMFIIHPNGTIIYEGAIDSIRSTDSADIPAATNYVRTALTEALSGKGVTTSLTAPYGCSVKY